MKYIYGMNNRPAGIGTAPKGFEISSIQSNDFRHGTVSYEKELTEEELHSFEMTPVGYDHVNVVAEYIIDKMGRYASKYSLAENKRYLDDKIFQELSSASYSKKISSTDFKSLEQTIKIMLTSKNK